MARELVEPMRMVLGWGMFDGEDNNDSERQGNRRADGIFACQSDGWDG